jgi:uncharacterized protein (TIGR02271 family)
MKTIVGLYKDFDTAQRVVEDLTDAGISRDHISLMANDASGQYASVIKQNAGDQKDVKAGEGAAVGAVAGALVGLGAMLIPGIGPVVAMGPLVAGLTGAGVGAVAGAATGGITASLVDMGVTDEDAGYYAEGVRRGGTLVVVQSEDNNSREIMEIMRDHSPMDVRTMAEEWRQSGWRGFDESSTPSGSWQGQSSDTSNAQYMRQTTNNPDQVKAEVVQEDLTVGKREVEKGGVRLQTAVTEQPVEEDITLREEHVNVERRPVNRPATDADFNTAGETYEFTERAEEPVVSKQARVVEEVVVNKDVEEHIETVSDTVRRKDVQVENLGSQQSGSMSSDMYASDWRNHYNRMYASGGHPYDYYNSAYQYGYTLANDQRMHDYSWDEVEYRARQNWESSNRQSAWEDVKDAVRHAWNRVRGIAD